MAVVSTVVITTCVLLPLMNAGENHNGGTKQPHHGEIQRSLRPFAEHDGDVLIIDESSLDPVEDARDDGEDTVGADPMRRSDPEDS